METEEPKLESKASEPSGTVDEYYLPDNTYLSKPDSKKRISEQPLDTKGRNQTILGGITKMKNQADKRGKG